MLYDISSRRPITRKPYAEDYARIAKAIPEELPAIKAALNAMIDGTEIQTASWMPGNDWTNTPFAPIYEKAANRNFDLSAKYFGLIVWYVFDERPEAWASDRYELDGVPIKGRTYFRINL